MTWRRALVAVVALVLAAGVATTLVLLRHGSGSSAARPPAARPAKATAVGNEITLSHAQSTRLVSWAARFRACVVARGVALGQPVAHAKEIDMRLEGAKAGPALSRKVIACGDSLGEPPRNSSLQLRPGKLVLYLPKQCLLDPKVVRGAKSL